SRQLGERSINQLVVASFTRLRRLTPSDHGLRATDHELQLRATGYGPPAVRIDGASFVAQLDQVRQDAVRGCTHYVGMEPAVDAIDDVGDGAAPRRDRLEYLRLAFLPVLQVPVDQRRGVVDNRSMAR